MLFLAVLLAAGPHALPASPPVVTGPRPPIPTFTPTPTATPTATPRPPRPTPVPTASLSAVARNRPLNTALPPGARLVFQHLVHSRTADAVSISGWLTNTGGQAACSVTMRVVVFDKNNKFVGSAEGSPRSASLAPTHGSPFEFSVPVPKPLSEDSEFEVGTVSPSITSYSNDCRP